MLASAMFGLFALLPVLALHAATLEGATPILIGMAVGAYGLTQAGLQIPLGALSDRIGRLPVIVGRVGRQVDRVAAANNDAVDIDGNRISARLVYVWKYHEKTLVSGYMILAFLPGYR